MPNELPQENTAATTDACYCGGCYLHEQQQKPAPKRSFAQCCQPIHLGKEKADSPEKLMRSRYSAFASGNADYLMKTLHPSKRTEGLEKELQQIFKHDVWLGLNVLAAPPVKNMGDGANATVEFRAFFSTELNGHQLQQIHEKSRFVFEDGRWFYVDGDMLPTKKIGRNDDCWCGSGRKFKKCHA